MTRSTPPSRRKGGDGGARPKLAHLVCQRGPGHRTIEPACVHRGLALRAGGSSKRHRTSRRACNTAAGPGGRGRAYARGGCRRRTSCHLPTRRCWATGGHETCQVIGEQVNDAGLSGIRCRPRRRRMARPGRWRGSPRLSAAARRSSTGSSSTTGIGPDCAKCRRRANQERCVPAPVVLPGVNPPTLPTGACAWPCESPR